MDVACIEPGHACHAIGNRSTQLTSELSILIIVKQTDKIAKCANSAASVLVCVTGSEVIEQVVVRTDAIRTYLSPIVYWS